MDNEDTNESKPSSSNPSSDKRTSPACARCRNHSVNIALKGHKRYCKYRYCMCRKCMETLARQKKMAKKTRQLRARKQDEDKKAKGKLDEEVSPFLFLKAKIIGLYGDLVIIMITKSRTKHRKQIFIRALLSITTWVFSGPMNRVFSISMFQFPISLSEKNFWIFHQLRVCT